MIRCLLKLWPVLRHCFRRQPRCRRCIASTPLGLCAECRAPEQEADPPSVDLTPADGFYSFALLYSGGKDSAYIKERLPGRVLCVTVDDCIGPVARVDDQLIIRRDLRPVMRAAFLSGRPAYEIDAAHGSAIFGAALEAVRGFGLPIVCGLTEAQLRSYPTDLLCPLATWRPKITAGPKPEASNVFGVALFVADMKRFGHCSFEPEFARLVRTGQADRRTWLYLFEIAECLYRWLTPIADRQLAPLGITMADVCRPR